MIQYSDSTIIIECRFDDILVLEPGLCGRMSGAVHSPEGRINVNEFYIQRVIEGTGTKLILKVFKPVELIFEEYEINSVCSGLTNFVFGGCSELSPGIYGFTIKIEGFDVSIVQISDYEDKEKKLEEKMEKRLVTSEIIFSFNPSDFEKVEQIIVNLSYLLSYSCRNAISPIYEDYFSEQNIVKTILRPILTRDYNNRDTVIDSDHISNCNIREYLEVTYPNYVKYKNRLCLNMVINFYLEGVTFIYMDMGFLLCTTALETLLSGYEDLRNSEENPINMGSIRRNEKKIIKIFNEIGLEEVDDVAELIASEISYKNLTVQEKLSAFIKDDRFAMELKEYDRDFSTIRNDIAHTGKFPTIINTNGNERKINILEEYNRLVYLLDRIILTILGFKGRNFLNKFNDYNVEIL